MSKYHVNEKPNAFDEIWRLTHLTQGQVNSLQKRKFVGVWMNPVFQNGWDNAGSPYHNYQYRLLFTDTLQTRGAIEGGDSGTVVFTVAESWRSSADIVWIGAAIGAGFATFTMDSATGEVSVSF